MTRTVIPYIWVDALLDVVLALIFGTVTIALWRGGSSLMSVGPPFLIAVLLCMRVGEWCLAWVIDQFGE